MGEEREVRNEEVVNASLTEVMEEMEVSEEREVMAEELRGGRRMG